MTATATAPMTGADFFARVKPTRRTIRTGLILRDDLIIRWSENEEALAEARAKDQQKPRRQAGRAGQESAATRKLAQTQVDLEAEMEDTKAWFTLHAMDPDKWQNLKDDNPPRKDNELDRLHGYNRDAVQDEAVRECLVDPAFEDCTDPKCDHDPERAKPCHSWQQFKRTISPSEWQELRESAAEVNGAVREAPKSLSASAILSRRGAGSNAPASGG